MSERSTSKDPTDIDRLFGRRMRVYRQIQGLSMSALGDACGCAHQQIQRYESGSNRVSLDRAVAIAAAFGTTVDQMLETPDRQSAPHEELEGLALALADLSPVRRMRVISELESLVVAFTAEE